MTSSEDGASCDAVVRPIRAARAAVGPTREAHVNSGCVLVVEDDAAIAQLVQTVLTEEGLMVALLRSVSTEMLREWVDREVPGCVLLDGAGRGAGFGESWQDAAWLGARVPPVPVIMFSADWGASEEARACQSARSQAAAFAAVLDKPFDLDALVATVTRIVRPPRTENVGPWPLTTRTSSPSPSSSPWC